MLLKPAKVLIRELYIKKLTQ